MTAGSLLRLPRWLRIGRTPRERARAFALLTAAGCVVSAEVIGRRGDNELHDVAAMLMLGVALMLVLSAHRLQPFPFLRSLRVRLRWLRGQLRARAMSFALDLRGKPRLPPAEMRTRRNLAIGLLVLCAGLALVRDVAVPVRELATRTIYTPYALALALLWTTLGLIALTGLAITVVYLHDWILARFPRSNGRVWRFTLLLVVASWLLIASIVDWVPNWAPIATAGLSLALLVSTIVRRVSPDFVLMSRPRARGESPRALLFSELLPLHFLLLHLVWLPPVLLAAEAQGPLTRWFGSLATWFGGIGIATCTLGVNAWLRASHRRDPARPSPTHLWLDREPQQRQRLAALCSLHGIVLRAPSELPEPNDVLVSLRDEPPRADERRWPWPVTRAELETRSFLEFVNRRDRAQSRTRILQVVERHFEMAKARTFECGNGYWFGPHLWFVPGLVRDEPERVRVRREWVLLDAMVGRPWHEVLSQHERHELYRVLDALEVDLVFVADDVTPEMVSGVLGFLFEHHDWHESRRLEDRDLSGIPGTRMILHEQGADAIRSDRYPQAEQETIGRARILHVFKDRGGHVENANVPSDDARMPRRGPSPLPL